MPCALITPVITEPLESFGFWPVPDEIKAREPEHGFADRKA
jgi:hypothetical protein